jgi:hypothetical protein
MIRWAGVRLAKWALMVLALLSFPAAADFRDDYRRGIEALESGEWSQAATLFHQAATERSEEKARLSRSPFSKRYLPHFYLGQALLGMGDCEAALAAWAESERQGVISRLPEYQSLVEGRDSCREQAATRSNSQRLAEVEIENAEAAAKRVARLQTDLGQQWAGMDSGLSARHDEAEQRLRAARSQLAVAVAAEDLDGMRQAAALARGSRDLLEAVERDAIQHQAQLRLQQGALRSEVASLLEQAEAQLASTAPLRPYPRQLGQVAAEVSNLIDESRQLGFDQDLASLRELRGALEEALVRLQEAAAPPPATLIEAAEAFFDGDYEEALNMLDGLDEMSRRAALEAHLLRAAASFTLYQLGGTSDAELLESARAEVISCLEIDPAKRPPVGPFSPRFVEFFDNQANSVSEGAAVADRQILDDSD